MKLRAYLETNFPGILKMKLSKKVIGFLDIDLLEGANDFKFHKNGHYEILELTLNKIKSRGRHETANIAKRKDYYKLSSMY